MTSLELTPEYFNILETLQPLSFTTAAIIFILCVLYLIFYNQLFTVSKLNHKPKTITLMILCCLIFYRSLVEFLAYDKYFPMDCELYEYNCDYCKFTQPVIPTVIFLIYFFISIFFNQILFTSLTILETFFNFNINIFFKILLFMTSIPMLVFSILITIKGREVEWNSIVVPFGDIKICLYNPDLFDTYFDYVKYQNPYLFTLIGFLLIIHCLIFSYIYKTRTNNMEYVIILKIYFKNISISLLYIICNFGFVMLPQYILNTYPFTPLEYTFTLLILLLYHPLGNNLYNLIFKRVLSGISKKNEEEKDEDEDEISIETGIQSISITT